MYIVAKEKKRKRERRESAQNPGGIKNRRLSTYIHIHNIQTTPLSLSLSLPPSLSLSPSLALQPSSSPSNGKTHPHLHDRTALLLTHAQHLRQVLLHLGLDLRVRVLLLLLLLSTTALILLLAPATLLIAHLRIRIAPLITSSPPLLLLLPTILPMLLPIPRPPAITLMVPPSMLRLEVVRHDGRPALKVDVDAARVLLRRVLQAELLADLLDFRFDLLDVAGRVVAFADDAVGNAPGEKRAGDWSAWVFFVWFGFLFSRSSFLARGGEGGRGKQWDFCANVIQAVDTSQLPSNQPPPPLLLL